MKPIRLLLVDDQDLIRESLHIILDMDPELQVVALAENGHIAIQACEEHHPNLILMDVHMPNMDGVEATKEIKKKWPQIRIIMLTTFREINYVVEALGAGAEGYLLKAIHPKDLIAGIKWVHQGGTLIPQEIAQMLVNSLQKNSDKNTIQKEKHHPTQETFSSRYDLSKRETEILQYIAEGANNKEIAQKLFLSEGTIKNYISSIYSKLEVRNRLQAAKKASQEGLI
ncbi:response regulator [Hazenella coriacea]|uniref:DNA-binding NarL/FixJ family response regulator n=1 Tax=Hazenella coriacea TaxID=1179467 RepID=A0A4R3L2Y6_9BACL|nr:response regulator transcription factor [Hazenella coriacea]TCS93582.1 DNA-binding NarL/FixJ family response regulator [Hazenella coriacea]